jgi:hypothetical protein
MKFTLTILALTPLMPACSGPDARDARYETEDAYTDDFESMTREEFMASMQDELEDFDRRVDALRAEAGPDDSFEQHADRLELARARFAQRLHSTQMSPSDWQTQRSSVIDAYQDLRDELAQVERDLMET